MMQYELYLPLSWPHLPPDFEEQHDSAWTWLPNSLYDSARGQDLYREAIETLAMAETWGFDGVCLKERHQTADGLTPAPMLPASALSQRTESCRLTVFHSLPLRDSPTRIAEELAMLDTLSGGRLVAGFGIGDGPDYFTFPVNPTRARERFREAVQLIKKAWTQPGPFPWDNKHYHVRYVSPWPTPMQKPHPPIRIAGDGSSEMIEYAARNRFVYLASSYYSVKVVRQEFDLFRKIALEEGYTAKPSDLMWEVPIHVAQTDAQAWTEFQPALEYCAKFLRKGADILPHGLVSKESALAIHKNRAFRIEPLASQDRIEEGMLAIVGSPRTVNEKLEHAIRELGVGTVVVNGQIGNLSTELSRRSLDLFGREVLTHRSQV